MNRLLKAPLLRFLFLAAAPITLSSASGSDACGFHDDVSIARGMLNWTYPDALHVIGAISVATAAKQLTRRESLPDLFGSHYRATVKALEGFAERLSAGADEAPPLSFSLVLVEPMLWTHFGPGPQGLRAEVHVIGPQTDQVVLVSGQDVIHAVANRGLGLGDAYRLGLIRAYGSKEKIAQFLRSIQATG